MSIPILAFWHWAVHMQCEGSASAVHGKCMGSAWNYKILKLVLGSLGAKNQLLFSCPYTFWHFGIGQCTCSARAVQVQCTGSAWAVHGQCMGSAWNYTMLKLVLGSLGAKDQLLFSCPYPFWHFVIGQCKGSARAVQGQCMGSACRVQWQCIEDGSTEPGKKTDHDSEVGGLSYEQVLLSNFFEIRTA